MRSILDYGAVGDGKTINTQAIQKAIDAGGTVYIPEGVFVTGTIYLKSNGGLYLESGAVLRASHDGADYNEVDAFPQNDAWPEEGMNGQHLILALEQENVFIEGRGTIDGQCHYWINESKYNSLGYMYDIEVEHPGQMVYFCECKGVSVRDVRLIDSPFWHLYLLGCQDATIDRVTIKGEPMQAVNDGIDIDCCQRVTVSNCVIDVGDDALTVRCCEGYLKEKRPSENITVNNCVVSSSLDNGIRVGVGSGVIRNCLFSNIIIHDSLQGINLNGRFNPAPGYNSAVLENIHFDNIIIQAHHPIAVMLSNWPTHPPLEGAYIKNITFSNIHSKSTRDSFVLGFEGGTVSDIRFLNSDFLLTGNGRNDSFATSDGGKWVWNSSEYAFRVEKADNVVFDNVRVSYDCEINGWEEDIYSKESKNLKITNCTLSYKEN